VALLPDFEKQTGNKVTFDNATAGSLARRIGEGEGFDVAVITAGQSIQLESAPVQRTPLLREH
jgi:ABC-type molybdate transport system substrate-binding protein